jgi:hypothetical protein
MTSLIEQLNVRRWKSPRQSIDLESWRSQPPIGDELLAAVEHIADIFERPFSANRIKGGLALD